MEMSYAIDMIPGGIPVRIPVSQYDKGREIRFALYQGGEKYLLPEGAQVRLEGTKPDGKCFLYEAAGTGSQVTAVLTQQMTAVWGRVLCQLRVVLGETLLGSGNFFLAVEKSPLPENGDLSASELSLIDHAAAAAEEGAKRAEAAAEAAEKAMDGKADKAVPTAPGNAALLTEDGNLMDSGLPLPARKTVSAWSEAVEPGWYQGPGVGLLGEKSVWGQVLGLGDAGLSQLVVSGSYPGAMALRSRVDGLWQSWEYLNPPMTLGNAYRTLERAEGKPVYRRLLLGGSAKNGSTCAYGVTAGQVLRVDVWMKGEKPRCLPYGAPGITEDWAVYAADGEGITLYCAEGLENEGAKWYAVVYYTL